MPLSDISVEQFRKFPIFYISWYSLDWIGFMSHTNLIYLLSPLFQLVEYQKVLAYNLVFRIRFLSSCQLHLLLFLASKAYVIGIVKSWVIYWGNHVNVMKLHQQTCWLMMFCSIWCHLKGWKLCCRQNMNSNWLETVASDQWALYFINSYESLLIESLYCNS